MKCPFCGHLEDKVVDSRSTRDGDAIRRRRECQECGRRFTSYEKIEEVSLTVIKRGGVREPFDRQKVWKGLDKACWKRPVRSEQIESIVDEAEQMVSSAPDRELATETIGEHVMVQLRDIDEVAYVRFASVYRQFKDISEFMEELEKLLAQR
jgi:transcriptional repressor NrdR